MKIFDFLSSFFKNNKTNKLCDKSNKDLYKKLIKDSRINDILNSIPKGLNEIEKAYYIYIELGKIVSEDPSFAFASRFDKDEIYEKEMSENFEGICRTLSRLYVEVLSDKRVKINAKSVKQIPSFRKSHINTLIKADGKLYVSNLIADLSKIKTSRRITCFAFDLNRTMENKGEEEANKNHYTALLEKYGEISYLSQRDIEKMDMKLGYSFGKLNTSNGVRGCYGNDTSDLLKKEFNDREAVKKYILKGASVPKEDVLKYKLEYLFKNVSKFTEYQGRVTYLDNIRYFKYLFKKILTPEEFERIKVFVIKKGKNTNKFDSILRIMPENDSSHKNYYYRYFNSDKTFHLQTIKNMKEYFKELKSQRFKIVGSYDGYSTIDNSELEI